METQQYIQNVGQKVASSLTVKVMVIVIITLLLLIPTAMIENLIHEREGYSEDVINSVSQSWGGSQELMGPFLTIPYTIQTEDAEGKVFTYSKELHLTPQQLNIKGNITTTQRHINIYDVTLYNTRLKFSGNFRLPESSKLLPEAKEIHFDKAYVSMSISDQAGIKENIFITWNKTKYGFNAGLPNKRISETGFHTPVLITAEGNTYDFDMDLNINGYKNLSFIPIGKETDVKLESAWPHPGFYGKSIPDEREVTDSGFTASWKIFHLNRNIPSQWVNDRNWDTESAFGVTLVEVVDEYQKNMRSAKYAFLIICLTFLTFFLTEVIKKNPLHPFQYVMAGFALVVFYILLLSFTEHTGFNIAYLTSSILTGGLIVVYMSAIFKDKKLTTLVGIFFTIIYGFIYIILQLEEYSLLVGSMGLFLALATAMMLTRKINWYELKKTP